MGESKKPLRKVWEDNDNENFETIEAYGCTCASCGCATVCHCDSPNNRFKITQSLVPDAANRKTHVGANSVYSM